MPTNSLAKSIPLNGGARCPHRASARLLPNQPVAVPADPSTEALAKVAALREGSVFNGQVCEKTLDFASCRTHDASCRVVRPVFVLGCISGLNPITFRMTPVESTSGSWSQPQPASVMKLTRLSVVCVTAAKK